MRHDKLQYFKSFFNYNDIAHFIAYVVYFVIRLEDTESTLPSTDSNRLLQDQKTLTILNLILLISGTLKVMFIVRVYEGIGWIVELVSQCMLDIKNFTIFFISINILFQILFQVCGVNSADEKDFVDYYQSWISVLRYSIGDIFDPPTFDYWHQSKHDQSTLMIFICLTIFTILIFIMLIVLLNFLIAVISQTYEEVMSRRMLTRQLHKASLNCESRMIMNVIGFNP